MRRACLGVGLALVVGVLPGPGSWNANARAQEAHAADAADASDAVAAKDHEEEETVALLTVEEYAAALESLAPLIESGQAATARDLAKTLLDEEVAFRDETFATDASLLQAVAHAEDGEIRGLAGRARRLAAAVRSAAGLAQVAETSDAARLQGLAATADVPRGGEVGALEVRELSFPERLGQAILAAWDWAASVVRKVIDWLARFWPDPEARKKEAAPTGAAQASLVVVAVAAAVLAVLAYRTLRRGRRQVHEIESDPVLSSSRDDDPLSREANEWEKHARDLAAAGRWREAVRAWYHAVLVCLFQRGLLHYQKGRTNWEYAARLGPELTWRPAFTDLTRRFDREWYGRAASDAEAVRECAQEARAILGAVRGQGEPA